MADLSQTATGVIAGPQAHRIPNVVLAETVSAGMPAYKLANGTYGKADGNDATKCVVAGYFEQGGAAGQRVNVVDKDPNANLGITGAVGDVIVLSSNAGMIAPVADDVSGDFVTVLGVFNTTTTVNWAPVAAGAVKA